VKFEINRPIKSTNTNTQLKENAPFDVVTKEGTKLCANTPNSTLMLRIFPFLFF
jgi:hypothetical protein